MILFFFFEVHQVAGDLFETLAATAANLIAHWKGISFKPYNSE